ncbi:MAG TPA: GNAT family N-acyltransferase [Blastocatellia bacterium]|nr:GNAT family N-acyltransferase [Blastocatellia bacterium]
MLVEEVDATSLIQTINKKISPPELYLTEGRYELKFARTQSEIDEVLRLRFEVFNLELGEGLESSLETGLDEDVYDTACHHLMVVDRATSRVIGTYRLMTAELAGTSGFYSASEFDLSQLPDSILSQAVELGRACIARDHRNTSVLLLLWKGLAQYAALNNKRYFFGCCSLTSQNPLEGWAIAQQLGRNGAFHREFFVPPRPGYECALEPGAANELPETKIPKLFSAYLRFGAKVCGPPALDRQFKTIDFFTLLDVNELSAISRRLLFSC